MLVTCTNCAARYAVDPLAIGPSGRTVECARCHHRWFQRVEGPPPPPAPRPAPAKMAMPEPAARAQLEIDFATSKIELVDGHYVVRGEIVNTGRATGSTSTLRLTFKKDDDVLGERSYSLVEGPIAPGARLAFRQTLDDPPSGTTDIVPAVE